MWYTYTMEYYTAEKKQWHLEICTQMDGSRKHHIYWGNPDSERQISYVLIHKCLLDIKQGKTSLQFTIPGNLVNNEVPKRDYMDLNYMGHRKRQDLLSKLGVCEPWERVKDEGGERKGRECRKSIAQWKQ